MRLESELCGHDLVVWTARKTHLLRDVEALYVDVTTRGTTFRIESTFSIFCASGRERGKSDFSRSWVSWECICDTYDQRSRVVVTRLWHLSRWLYWICTIHVLCFRLSECLMGCVLNGNLWCCSDDLLLGTCESYLRENQRFATQNLKSARARQIYQHLHFALISLALFSAFHHTTSSTFRRTQTSFSAFHYIFFLQLLNDDDESKQQEREKRGKRKHWKIL